LFKESVVRFLSIQIIIRSKPPMFSSLSIHHPLWSIATDLSTYM
jgi:hypothetical protein